MSHAPTPPSSNDSLVQAFESSRRTLWRHMYRLTGSACDADDLVQETFRRALENPPPDQTRRWQPWLVRVATHLALDALRARRTRPRVGPWLPEPVETEALTPGPDERLEALEHVSYAFLVALERLEPRERAALLLADVLGHSGPEIADILETTPGNARVLLHRARSSMAELPAAALNPSRHAATQAALTRLLSALGTGSIDAVAELLAADVRTTQDAGGEFHAATRELVGAHPVAKLYVSLAANPAGAIRVEFVELNGLPALRVEIDAPDQSRYARRMVLRVEVDEAERIVAIQAVLASAKLRHAGFE